MVIKEFNLIDEHAVIYKLVGPVLAKQELVEARQNVEKRLEYMNSELYAKSDLIFYIQKTN